MTETALQPIDTTIKAITLTGDEMDFIRTQLVEGDITDNEFKLFIAMATYTGANPLLKEVYAYKFKGKSPKMAVVFSYTFLIRKVREKDPDFVGFTIPEYYDGKGWTSVWIDSKTAPLACRIGLMRKGREPAYAQSLWNEKVQLYNGTPMNQWKVNPVQMLTKCTQTQAIKNVYGSIVGTMLVQEEMADPAEVAGAVQMPDGTWQTDITAEVTPDGLKAASDEIKQRSEDSHNVKGGRLFREEPKITIAEKEKLRLILEDLGLKPSEMNEKVNSILGELGHEPIKKSTDLAISQYNEVMDVLQLELKGEED